MKTKIISYLSIISIILFSSSCHQNEDKATDFISIQNIDSPAGEGSSEPNLFAGKDGRLYLSWIQPVNESRHALRFAVRETDSWSQPFTITEGDNWFVNWADFPSLVAFEDGSLTAHWLVKSGEGTYAYNISIAHSTDGGNHWSEPIVPHRDRTQTEHGFVSMLPWTNDHLFVIWLDGRNFAQGGNGHPGHSAPTYEMTLRFAMVDKNGQLHYERILDNRVCDCCPTSAVRTPNGALVVYRDRTEQEIRDISIIRFQNGAWSEPSTLYKDEWEIKGCPVNGPAIATERQVVAVAWFTMAQETPRVKVAFSNNEGMDFSEPINVDDGNPLGRVDVIMLPESAVVVSWMETVDAEAEIRVRRIRKDGTREPSITLTKSTKERASGFPRMVRRGDDIYFAWTQPGKPSTVRAAVAKLSGY